MCKICTYLCNTQFVWANNEFYMSELLLLEETPCVPGRDSRLDDLTSNERLIIEDLASGVPVSMLGGDNGVRSTCRRRK